MLLARPPHAPERSSVSIRAHAPLVVHADPKFPVNKGGLCVKGWASAETIGHPERLLTPLIRCSAGSLEPATWDEAFAAIAARFRQTQSRGGRDAVAVLGGGSLTNEKAYLLGKFARVALGTANIDYNGRFCMSAAAAAGERAFGVDRGMPFPLEDVAQTSVILLAGGNPAETMPPIMQYFAAQQARGGTLIVVDPRRTPTAAWATRHLSIRPGTDAALANGLLHVLVRDRLIDERYVSARTEGFDDARRVAMLCWPEQVERITGIPERAIAEAAHLLAKAPAAMVLTARGPEQQASGVRNALAYINVALALGLPGRPFSGYGTLTGQGNGQGGREHGQKADQLPGYRKLTDPDARRHVASVWKVPEADIPGPGKSALEILEALGGEIRALFVMGFNPVVSAPDATRVIDRLRALDTLVVSDFFLSETAALADVVLPSALWAEEDGTMTNLEGRVIRRRRAAQPPASVLTDVDILGGIAAALGRHESFSFATPREVFDELRRATRGGKADYSGITYERIDAADGIFWPCPDVDHPGTPRLFEHTFPTATGRAKFHATPPEPMPEARTDEFPLHLTTGRTLAQYQSGSLTRRIAELNAAAPEPVAEMHPSAARTAGVSEGDPVTLTTRRGSAVFTARLVRTIRPDTVFVPFHWSGTGSANTLTIAALDPISRMPSFKTCAVRIEPGRESRPESTLPTEKSR
jgi:assimilatory nitrate reductase catalytic subunit